MLEVLDSPVLLESDSGIGEWGVNFIGEVHVFGGT